ncbi:hypothetical protein OG594_08675 [Streptomyces sp. NBC_01214]|uniref:hypothetical protein n=1 Tax=Streptomyces sp. NBC_01214 TaxID=2903777 RepID=UPI0022513CDF|nr:hypothetical protein [Streptomyces sp. NBC_01214]MCX4801723.1 hypothetical protein [Streptomyces sp. NBC_01214]
MNWAAHDARTSDLSPAEEAALIRCLARERSQDGRSHGRGCLCPACHVRRADATMRALRMLAADAKQAA